MTIVLERGTADDSLYDLRGFANFQLGRLLAARSDFSDAVLLNPTNARHYVSRASVYRAMSQHNSALDDIQRALELDPKHVGALRGRGESLIAKGRYSNAIESLSQAIDINPSWPSVYLLRGDAYAALNLRENAIADYGRAILLTGDEGMARRRKATLHFILGDFVAAAAAYCGHASVKKNRDVFHDALLMLNCDFVGADDD